LIARNLLILLALSWNTSLAQKLPSEEIIQRISKRPFDINVITSVMESRDPSFLPALRKAFEETSEKSAKQVIASTLIKLGDPASEYFDYLAQFALQAVTSLAPSALVYDAEGRSVRGKISPEFELWCQANGLDPVQEAGKQIWTYGNDVFELAQTRDRRAIGILRQGLDSNNRLIVQITAEGLASLQDTVSVQRIIAVTDRIPTDEMRAILGNALTLYEESTVEKQILAARDRRLAEKYTEALRRKREPKSSK